MAFITQPKRAKTTFEQRYVKLYGDHQARRVDLPGLSPGVIQKRQELEHAQSQLAADRLDYEWWLREHQQRKVDIEQKMNEVRDEEQGRQVIKRRMRDEIDRFKALSEQEYEFFQKSEAQLASLNAKEAAIRERLAHYEQQLKILQPSASFIERVVGETKMFQTPNTIIQRYEALIAAKIDWTADLKRHLAESGQVMGPRERLTYLQSTLIQKRHELRSLREEIAKFRHQYNYAMVSTMKNAERGIEKKTEEAAVVSSIENMCRQSLVNQKREARSNIGFTVPATMEEQLEIIKQRFLNLRALIDDPDIIYATAIGLKSLGRIQTRYHSFPYHRVQIDGTTSILVEVQ
jgi:hypothetical protein